MNFFTPEIYKGLGGLDLELQGLAALQDANEKYAARLSQIRDSLSADLAAVADAWYVDDALIAKLRQSDDPAKLLLTLRCGNLLIGYFDLDFSYESPEVTDEHLRTLVTIATNTRGNRMYGGWDAWVHEVERRHRVPVFASRRRLRPERCDAKGDLEFDSVHPHESGESRARRTP